MASVAAVSDVSIWRQRTNGRKHHIVTDTIGLLIVVLVIAASVQDLEGRAGTEPGQLNMLSIVLVWADGG